MRIKTVAFSLAGTLAIAGAITLGMAGCGQQPAASTSASASASASVATEQSTKPAAPAINWTDAENADKAATGAKLKKFGVPASIVVDNSKYENPKYAYSNGTAQATYTVNGSSLVIRKANKDSKVAITDVDIAKAEATWSKTYEGIQVVCYGPAKGAAYTITWRDGDLQYGVTRQGSGDQKPTMDNDDAAAVVKAVKEANATATSNKTTEQKKTNSNTNPTSTTNSNTTPASTTNTNSTSNKNTSQPVEEDTSMDDAKSIAVQAAGLGTNVEVYAELVQGTNGKIWHVTVSDGNVTKAVEIDAATFEVYSVDVISGSQGTSTGDGENTTPEQNSTPEQTDTSEQSYIGETAAIQSALASLGLDGSESNCSATLVTGGDAAHYNVTVTTNGETQTVEVDAYTGQAW